MEMEYHQKTGDEDAYFLFSEFSIGSFFPITHRRFHFNIYVWLHVYPTSHLCVALHFLIFVFFIDMQSFFASAAHHDAPL